MEKNFTYKPVEGIFKKSSQKYFETYGSIIKFAEIFFEWSSTRLTLCCCSKITIAWRILV
jgi:hypothetical protein